MGLLNDPPRLGLLNSPDYASRLCRAAATPPQLAERNWAAELGALALPVDEWRKRLVWSKGKPMPGCDPDVWRLDAAGNIICFNDHGDRESSFGWEIDHAQPSILGGSDAISNLRPLHHRVNSSLGGLLGSAITKAR